MIQLRYNASGEFTCIDGDEETLKGGMVWVNAADYYLRKGFLELPEVIGVNSVVIVVLTCCAVSNEDMTP